MPPAAPPHCAAQVPFTYIDYESNGKLWPGIHHMFNAVERFQVVNSYGLFRRMTGVGGRPEVVLEGSYDKQTWTVSPHLAPRAGMGLRGQPRASPPRCLGAAGAPGCPRGLGGLRSSHSPWR